MSNNCVCLKCLNPIDPNDFCQKSEFEYFHTDCLNNDDLIDVTDIISDWNDVTMYDIFKLNTQVNKFNGKFIDLSSKEKILEIYNNNKYKKILKNEIKKDLIQLDLNKLDDLSSDDFINELNKNISLMDNKYLKNFQYVN